MLDAPGVENVADQAAQDPMSHAQEQGNADLTVGQVPGSEVPAGDHTQCDSHIQPPNGPSAMLNSQRHALG